MLRSSSLHRLIHSCSDPYLSTVRSRAVELDVSAFVSTVKPFLWSGLVWFRITAPLLLVSKSRHDSPVQNRWMGWAVGTSKTI
ncbi:hypothetical protein AAC387_Pa03g4008 [Persea americana]